MALDFARRLHDVVAIARRNSQNSLSFGLGMVADVILESLEAVDSDFPPINTDCQSVVQAIEIARGAATILDACLLIEAHLFSAPAEHCFLEFTLPHDRSRDSLTRFFDDKLRRAESDSGFIYAVWTFEHERCLYLARRHEDNAQTLDLSTRAQLLTALQQGSLLAVMRPSPMSAATTLDVEAAISTVFDSQHLLAAVGCTSMPVRAAREAAHLAEISRLFHELGSKFQSPIRSKVAG